MGFRRGLALLAVGIWLLAACGSPAPTGPLLPPNTPIASATLEIAESSVGVVLAASPTGSVTATSEPTTTGTPPTATPTLEPGQAATGTAAAAVAATGTAAAPSATAGTPGPATATPTAQLIILPTNTPGRSNNKDIGPSQVPPSPVSSIVLLSLTTPIKKGADATLIIQTAPEAGCFLTYVEPGGVVSTAEGLGKKTADDSGLCRWDWKIGSTTRAGSGRLSVAAKGPAVSFDIVVVP
jgi:hypothetical protein